MSDNNYNNYYMYGQPPYPYYNTGYQGQDQMFQNLYVRKAKDPNAPHQETPPFHPDVQPPPPPRKTSTGEPDSNNKRKSSRQEDNKRKSSTNEESKRKGSSQMSPKYVVKEKVEKKPQPVTGSPWVEKKVPEVMYVEKKQAISSRKGSEQVKYPLSPIKREHQSPHKKASIVYSKEHLIKLFQELHGSLRPPKALQQLNEDMVPIVQLMPQYVDLEHVNPCPRRLESLVKASPYSGPKNRKESFNK